MRMVHTQQGTMCESCYEHSTIVESRGPCIVCGAMGCERNDNWRDHGALGYPAPGCEWNDNWRDHGALGYPAPGCERNNNYIGIHALATGLASPGNTGMGHRMLAPENPSRLSDCVFLGIDAGADERDAQGLVIIGDGIRSREQARSMSGLLFLGDRVIIGPTLYGQSISNLAEIVRFELRRRENDGRTT